MKGGGAIWKGDRAKEEEQVGEKYHKLQGVTGSEKGSRGEGSRREPVLVV